MIIGLSGHIKSGKSTAAQLIQSETNNKFVEKYFAYKLKFIASYLTGDPIQLFETQEGKEGFLDDWGMTRREILQKLGTESLRENFDKNVWIKGVFADYKPLPVYADLSDDFYTGKDEYPNWIISDVRFPNEADAIKQKGGLLLRVNRPVDLIYPSEWNQYATENKDNDQSEKGFKEWLSYGDSKQFDLFKKLTHPSETGLDDYEDFDFIVNNNDTLESFQTQIKQIIHEHLI